MIILGVGVENAVAACGGLNANSDDWTYSMTGNSDDNQCASCPVVFNLSDSPSQYGAVDDMWYVLFESYKVYGVALDIENSNETCSCAVDKFVKIIQTDSEPQEETLLELNGTGNVFEVNMESSGCLFSCAQWFHDNESERINSGFWYQDPEKFHALRNTVTDCSFQLIETETGGTKTYKVSAKNTVAWGNKELILLSPKTGYCVNNTSFVAIDSLSDGKYCDSSKKVQTCPDGTCCLNGNKYDCIRGTYSSAGTKCKNNTAGQCGAARDGNYFEGGLEKTCLAGTCCLAGIKYDCKDGTVSVTNGSVCTGVSDDKGLCPVLIENGQYLTSNGSVEDCEMGYCCYDAKKYECADGTFTVSTKTSCTDGVEGACLKFSGGNGGWTWPASGLNIGPINLSGN